MAWLFSQEALADSPSRRDGVTMDAERAYRFRTAWILESICTKLGCTRPVAASALVLLHRFFTLHSFKKHDREVVCLACIFLASKIEEKPLRLRDVVNAFISNRKIYSKSPLTEAECKELPNKVLLLERIVLSTLSFDLQITLPYQSLAAKVRALKSYVPESMREDFHKAALSFVNDSFRTNLCLQFPPNHIAIAGVFLATIQLELTPQIHSSRPSSSSAQLTSLSSPSSSPEMAWFELLEADIDEASLKSICMQILDVMDSGKGHMGHGSSHLVGCEQKSIETMKLKCQMFNASSNALYMYPSPNCVSVYTPPSDIPYAPETDAYKNVDEEEYPYGEQEENRVTNVKVTHVKTVSNETSFMSTTSTSTTTTYTSSLQPPPTPPPPPPPPLMHLPSASPASSQCSTPALPPPPPPPDTPILEVQSSPFLPSAPPPPPPDTPDIVENDVRDGYDGDESINDARKKQRVE